VYKDWGKPTQQALASLTAAEARALYDAGQFPKGSMGPKIDAALKFVEAGGREVLITDPSSLSDALEGRSGTYVRNA
jgi:carbamate kinase